MSSADVLLFIDAIEEDQVFVLLGERRYRLPRALLPAAAKEGSWLRLGVATSPVGEAIDEASTRLGGSDDGGDIEL